MPKDVRFNIKLQIDGKEQIVTATTNVKALASELGIARDKSEAFRNTLINFNQLSQSFQNALSGLQQITGLMQEYTAAARVQEEAETKLATVMRQRMNATDSEIDSIKRLASAQQEIGVIGDEVQLAGAQQIATFLREKSSLEILIPAMNNLLAQQKGLSATGMDAVNVGNMMGKVLQGQTSALRRVGITFTEAQENLLKYGDELTKASTLAQVITDNVGNMNAELAKTDSGKAQQAANAFGDLKEQIGAIFAPMESAIINAGKLAMAVNALTTTTSGIMGLVKAFRTLNLAVIRQKASSIAAAVAAKTHSAALAVLRVSAIQAANASKALRLQIAAVQAAISMGLTVAITGAIALITRLIGKQKEASEAAQRAKDAENAYTDGVAKARAAIEADISRLKVLIDTKGDERGIVAELNEKYKDQLGTYDTVAKWYDTLTSKSETYCKQLGYQALMLKYQDQLADLMAKKMEAENTMASEPETRTVAVTSPSTGALAGTITQANPAYDKAKKNAAKYGDEIGKLTDSMKKAAEQQSALNRSLSSGTGTGVPSGDAKGAKSGNTSSGRNLSDDIAKYRTSVERAVDVNRVFGEGQTDQDTELKAMRSGIISLISTYGAEEEAIKKLIKEYNDLIEARQKSREASIGPALEKLSPIEAKATTEKGNDLMGDIGGDEKKDPLKTIQDNADTAQTALGGLSGAFGTLSDAVKGNAKEWLSWVSNVMQSIGQAISAIAGLIVAKKAQELQAHSNATANAAEAATGASASVASIPFVGPALAVAAVATVLASLLSLPKFAKGGLAYGPTVGMFGEYPGASNNPEVVAPLDRLRTLIGTPEGAGGNVQFRIEGRNLVGVLEKERRYRNRMG